MAPVRCWSSTSELYNAYHDDEWGRPATSERALLEKLCLEGFQSGLSWLTILRKRERFREVFAGFEPDALGGFGERDVKRLLGDAGIVRNRAKIEASIANARATVALRETGRALAELVWSHRPPPRPAPQTLGELPAHTPESRALSSALKRCGFRFVGPTTVYSMMQSCGLVNDHIAACFVRADVAAEQAAVTPPGA